MSERTKLIQTAPGPLDLQGLTGAPVHRCKIQVVSEKQSNPEPGAEESSAELQDVEQRISNLDIHERLGSLPLSARLVVTPDKVIWWWAASDGSGGEGASSTPGMPEYYYIEGRDLSVCSVRK